MGAIVRLDTRLGWILAMATTTASLAGCGQGAPEPERRSSPATSAPAPASFAETTPDKPVLLVTIDTLRWDALGSYGAESPTPELDALAEAGVRFEHAVAHAVVTLPSHASILSGIDPSRHGIHDNDGYRLGDDVQTWAERLKADGYATAAFIGAFPLDSLFGLAQGFDLYDDSYEGDAGPDSLKMVERGAEAVVAPAREWLADRSGPWFAWVHVYDPHAPYEPPPPFDDRYAADPYAGEVAYVDAALGPLLEDALGRDALVILTSDHGEALGDHGEETHGAFAYASTLRVPLIVAGLPEGRAGDVVQERVRHIDVLPTVLDALGIEPEGIQGVSLAGVIGGARHPEPTSYFEALTPYLDWGWAPLRGLYEGSAKYIDLPIPELYDVDEDPREENNLFDERAARALELRDRLHAHLAGAAERIDEPAAEDPETLRRLRALGYVGASEGSRDVGEEFGPEDDPKRLIALEGELQQAVRALEAGRLQQAGSLLEDILRRRPDFARAHTLLAAVRERESGPLAAVRVLEDAVDEGWETPYLLARLGHFYQRAGRLPQAERAVERALEFRPDDVELLARLATIHGESGRPREARELLRRALELDPTYGRLHANRGTLLMGSGRLREAEEAFREALRYDSSLSEAHNGLGVLAHERGNPAEAVEHWRQAIIYKPDEAFALYNLGVTLARLGRREEAAEALERYLELNPADEDARELLGQLRR